MPKKGKPSRKRVIDISSYNLSTDDLEQRPQLQFCRSLQLRKAETLQFLSGSNMPSKFRFRQKQIQKIQCFLQECLSRQKKGYRFLMVTGSPGAGKTLSINSVLAGCQCEVIRLNANLVRTVAEVQTLINLKLLGDDTPRTAPQMLRQLEEQQYKGTCVVYVEEIQLLFKSAPDAVSEDFLTLFLRKSVNLVLLGISNTIDTIQKYSGRYSFKTTEIENVVFAPYKAEHIISILQDKLAIIAVKFKIQVEFPQKLLKFAAQKLQALRKGDFRICLQFLKETVRLCLSAGEQSQSEPGVQPRFVITIVMINQTFSKMHISKNELMSKLPYQQAIMLIGLHNITLRTDGLYVSLKELQPELKWICGSLQIGHSAQLMDDRLRELEQYGMVLMRKRGNNELQVVLQVSTDDIRATFAENQLLGKFLLAQK